MRPQKARVRPQNTHPATAVNSRHRLQPQPIRAFRERWRQLVCIEKQTRPELHLKLKGTGHYWSLLGNICNINEKWRAVYRTHCEKRLPNNVVLRKRTAHSKIKFGSPLLCIDKHITFWNKGCFFFHYSLPTSMTNWVQISQICIVRIMLGYTSGNTGLWQLPKVSSAFKTHRRRLPHSHYIQTLTPCQLYLFYALKQQKTAAFLTL